MDSRITAITLGVREQPWGGISGYFADPDGFRWEIVYNPGLSFDAAGNASFSEGV